MKKFILSLAVCLCAAFSAQAQSWNLGGRISGGIQAQAEYNYSDAAYVEGRLGLNALIEGMAVDLTALHMWNVATMDWTPSAGQWFVDLGAGAGIGGGKTLFAGVAGSAKFGIHFNDAPIRLAIDWTPIIGINGGSFYGLGCANVGISCVYCF